MQRGSLKRIISILLICLMTSSCDGYCASNRVLVRKITHENLDYIKCKVELTWFDKILGKDCEDKR